ncbi:MAG: hypothetical protein LBH04_07595 [Tannerellaceae bacterium]|jgi:hypothetical protein|nr:hypothetical protein [Tannerellaceae bacterium]
MGLGSWAMLTLYLCYYMAATSFYHVHYYGNVRVVHSHICFVWDMDGERMATHQHTQAQLRSIASLMDIVLAGVALFTLCFAAMTTGRLYIQPVDRDTCERIFHKPVRAPPF